MRAFLLRINAVYTASNNHKMELHPRAQSRHALTTHHSPARQQPANPLRLRDNTRCTRTPIITFINLYQGESRKYRR